MATDAFRRKRLIHACELFAGKRWQTAVARVSGVPQSTLSMIVARERKVTIEVERAVFTAIVEQASVTMRHAGAAADNAALALIAIGEK